MTEDLRDLSAALNLRAALDVWPEGAPLPTTAEQTAEALLTLTLPHVLAGTEGALWLLRVAVDGATLWVLDALHGLSIEDLVRAVAVAFVPAAHAMAVVQPMRAAGDPTVQGVHCRAMFGDDLIELQGAVTGLSGPVAARQVPQWQVRHGRVIDDRGRWIGVLPTVEVHLPLLGAAEA